MRNVYKGFVLMCAWASVASGENLIWQIGARDGSAAEFALAGAWTQFPSTFPRDCFYIVGQSSPDKDWSYVLPGPSDAWAQGRTHRFVIVFGLAQAPRGPGKLCLDFVDTRPVNPPVLSVSVNGHVSERPLPIGGSDDSLRGDYVKGKAQATVVEVPATHIRKGTNFVTITNKAGFWAIFDSVRLQGSEMLDVTEPSPASAIGDVQCEPCLGRGEDGKEFQPATLTAIHLGPEMEADVLVDTKVLTSLRLRQGVNTCGLQMPAVDEVATQTVALRVKGRTQAKVVVAREPVRRWVAHIIPQTHLDIGYTHTQQEVLKRQVRQLRDAMDYVDASRSLEPEARFRWHPEGMWAVEEFMHRAGAKEKDRFIEQARAREIHLDALYAQAMTGLYSEEELFELMACAKQFERTHGVVIDSAMQTDVPGYTWGLVSVLAVHGVRYISVGPNFGHRVGHTFHWADKPFYWVAPNGKDKVLFWMAGRGYSMFQRAGVAKYSGLEDNQLLKYMDDVLRYLRELERSDYPYDMVMLRYSIGSDNGPPDPTLSAAVADWNRRWASPRFVIDTNSNFLKTFEQRYGQEIPRLSGDFTGYWEDGAASTAADTAVVRQAAERLVQTQTLWAMRGSAGFPSKRFDQAWNNLIMYDEHTWGAWNSISDPDNDFVKQQAQFKQQYALEGKRLTDELLSQAAGAADASSGVIDVYNTLYWDRSELVELSPEQSAVGDRVVDEAGHAVPSQRLACAKLAFLAQAVPAFGARRFRVVAGEALSRGTVRVSKHTLENDQIIVGVDPATGAVTSLRRPGEDVNLVKEGPDDGLNNYLYILGRDATQGRHRVNGAVTVRVEDAGPLVGTLRIECDAAGTRKLMRRVRLVSGQNRVELVNVVDKAKQRRPESVSFAFAFDVPDGVMKIDTPWAIWQPEKGQLAGANRNFFCVQRWVDISNAQRGVTWVSLDAPLVQWDPILFADAWNKERFRKELQPNQTIHSWVMNNHWETNYAADQEGAVTFRYVIWPHAGGYDAPACQRVGRSAHQPLLVFAGEAGKPVPAPLLKVSGEAAVISMVRPTRDGRGHIVRVFNTTDKPTRATLQWLRGPVQGWFSDPLETRVRQFDGSLDLGCYDVITLRFDDGAK